jgi:hypothetical protein
MKNNLFYRNLFSLVHSNKKDHFFRKILSFYIEKWDKIWRHIRGDFGSVRGLKSINMFHFRTKLLITNRHDGGPIRQPMGSIYCLTRPHSNCPDVHTKKKRKE